MDKIIILYFSRKNLKQSPTKLSLNISDQTINNGTISINGNTITKATDIVFTATSTGLKQSLLEAFRKASGATSNSSIPSNVKIIKISKLEKVNTISNSSNEIMNVACTYDIKYGSIQENSYFMNEFMADLSLNAFDFVLPSTLNNINSVNSPKIGDKLRATFYYITLNDIENINFTRNGTLYTNKNFAFINKCYVSSGFNSSLSTKLIISNFNQPITNSRYKIFYDYLAPKPNERIIIRYNYNKLIGDVQLGIEKSRPINADILVKEAKQILVDLTINVTINKQSLSSSALILQNLKDTLISNINSTGLGATLDASSLISAAFSVSGISGARIIYFNKSGISGQVLQIKAQNDQYLTSNNIIVNLETR